MPLLAGNKVVFLNVMEILQNNVGEVSNNIVHEIDNPLTVDIDHTDISNKHVESRP